MVRCIHYLSRIRLEDGGVARAVLDFCRVFAGLGNQVTLLTGDATDVPPEWQRTGETSTPNQGLNLPRVALVDEPRGLLELFPIPAKLRATELLRDCDLLHLHAPWTPSNVQLASIAHRLGVPYVLSAHGMLDDWSMARMHLKKRLFLTLAANRMMRRAARVHCTAQAELDQAAKWLPRNNGVVLPLVMDLSSFETLPGPDAARQRFPLLRSDGVKLLFLSRVHPKKGVDLLIRAVAELQRQGRKTTLLVAGPGETRYVNQLRKLSAELGVGAQIEFPGMVRGVEKLSLYQAADLFVLPTSQENFGLVLVEAMACRLPVITTRGVDIWKELSEAGASIIEPTPAAIAAGIQTLLADPTFPQRGNRGRAWVLDKLDPQCVARRYESLYQQISDETRETR